MEINFGDYLRHLRLKRGYTVNQLALKSGVSNAHISRLERGKRPAPSPEVIEKLAQALNADYEDLLQAAGYLNRVDTPEITDALPVGKMVRVPIYGEIRAGQPMLVQEQIVGYDYIPVEDVRGGEYFFLRVKGDSMAGARILEGDLVLVRKQPTLENGQIGVVIVGNEATIKRFYQQGDLAILKPENPAYQPIVAPLKDVTIVGEVVEAKIRFNGR